MVSFIHAGFKKYIKYIKSHPENVPITQTITFPCFSQHFSIYLCHQTLHNFQCNEHDMYRNQIFSVLKDEKSWSNRMNLGKKMFCKPQINEKACKQSLYEGNRCNQSHTLFPAQIKHKFLFLKLCLFPFNSIVGFKRCRHLSDKPTEFIVHLECSLLSEAQEDTRVYPTVLMRNDLPTPGLPAGV